MPRRLFRASPSKLLAWVDCPRRYRMQYLDRPAPTVPSAARAHLVRRGRAQRPAGLVGPAGRAAHAGRRSRAGADVLDRPGLPRRRPVDASGASCAQRQVVAYLDDVDPAHQPLGIERTVSLKTDVFTLQGRIDRLDDRGGRAGGRRLQDESLGADRRRRPHVPAAGPLCRRGVEDVPSQVRSGRAAPPAERRGRHPRAHRRLAQAQDRRGRVDRAGRPPGRGGLRRVRCRLEPVPRQGRSDLPVVRLPRALPGRPGVRAREVRLGGAGAAGRPAEPTGRPCSGFA